MGVLSEGACRWRGRDQKRGDAGSQAQGWEGHHFGGVAWQKPPENVPTGLAAFKQDKGGPVPGGREDTKNPRSQKTLDIYKWTKLDSVGAFAKGPREQEKNKKKADQIKRKWGDLAPPSPMYRPKKTEVRGLEAPVSSKLIAPTPGWVSKPKNKRNMKKKGKISEKGPEKKPEFRVTDQTWGGGLPVGEGLWKHSLIGPTPGGGQGGEKGPKSRGVSGSPGNPTRGLGLRVWIEKGAPYRKKKKTGKKFQVVECHPNFISAPLAGDFYDLVRKLELGCCPWPPPHPGKKWQRCGGEGWEGRGGRGGGTKRPLQPPHHRNTQLGVPSKGDFLIGFFFWKGHVGGLEVAHLLPTFYSKRFPGMVIRSGGLTCRTNAKKGPAKKPTPPTPQKNGPMPAILQALWRVAPPNSKAQSGPDPPVKMSHKSTVPPPTTRTKTKNRGGGMENMGWGHQEDVFGSQNPGLWEKKKCVFHQRVWKIGKKGAAGPPIGLGGATKEGRGGQKRALKKKDI